MKYEKELIELADICALLDKSDAELEQRGIKREDIDSKRYDITQMIIRKEFMPDVSEDVVREATERFFMSVSPEKFLQFIYDIQNTVSINGSMASLFNFWMDSFSYILQNQDAYKNDMDVRDDINAKLLRSFGRAMERTRLSPRENNGDFGGVNVNEILRNLGSRYIPTGYYANPVEPIGENEIEPEPEQFNPDESSISFEDWLHNRTPQGDNNG